MPWIGVWVKGSRPSVIKTVKGEVICVTQSVVDGPVTWEPVRNTEYGVHPGYEELYSR